MIDSPPPLPSHRKPIVKHPNATDAASAFVSRPLPLPMPMRTTRLHPMRRPRPTQLAPFLHPNWHACAAPGTPQYRSRPVPQVYSTYRDNPLRTRAGQQSEISRAQRHRKKGKWRLALSILLALEQYSVKSTEFLTELVHLRAAEAMYKYPNLTPRDLSDLLFAVIDESMARPVSATANAVLCALQKRMSGPAHNALDTLDVCVRVLDAMARRGIPPDDFSFSLTYRMSALAGSSQYLRLFETRAQEALGSYGGAVTCSSLLCARGKLGNVDGAEDVATDMRERGLRFNDRAYACLIGACHRSGRHARVVQVFQEAMAADHVVATPYLFSGVVASCCKVGDCVHARLALEIMRDRDVLPTVEILDSVFNTATWRGDLSLADDVLFDWACSNSAFIHRSEHFVKLIASAGRNRMKAVVEDMVTLIWNVVTRMEELDVSPDVSVLNAMASSLVKLGKLEDARAVVQVEMPKRGIKADVGSYNALIRALGLEGELGRAVAVVDLMREKGVLPDQVTYNSLLELSRQCGDDRVRNAVLQEIRGNPILKMDMVATTVLLKGMRERKDADGVMKLHGEIVRRGQVLDAKAYGLVLTILLECGRDMDGIGVFGWLMQRRAMQRNIYNVMIHQFGQRKDGFEICERLFERMKRDGCVADEFTYTSMIRACSRHGQLDRAFRILGEMQDVGVGMSDSFAWTALIDGCGRGGMWERGVELLQKMRRADGRTGVVPRPTTASYNAALYAAGVHGGSWDVALNIFKALIADKKAPPNAVSYSAMASIILRHRFEVCEIGVVVDVLDKLVQIVTEEGQDCVDAGPRTEARRGRGHVPSVGSTGNSQRKRFAFGRRLDRVELKKLQSKVKRLGWIVQFKKDTVRRK